MLAAVGALVAPATASAATTFEAETMSVASGVATATTDSAASGGKTMTLWGNAAITKTVTTQATSRVVVRAKGAQCAGAPSMQIQVDGSTVQTAAVAATTLTDYSAALNVAAGSHTVRIAFTNDYQESGCDRNLIVDSVTISDAATTSTSTTQAEAMTLGQGTPHGDIVSEAAASGGKAVLMRSNNTATAKVSLAASTSVTVRARGTQCNGAPQLTFTVDGKQVLSTSVTATTYTDYRATVSVAAGTHTVQVAFTNDFSSTACDRNLYVDSVTFNGSTTGTTAPAPTPTPTPAAPTPTPTPAPTGDAPRAGYWTSTFAGTGQEPTDWTTWGPTSEYGAWGQGQSNEIDTPSSFGVPAPPSNISRVARLWHAAGDPAIHHKLYKSFRASTWPSGTGSMTNASPANVSGRYISEFYIDTRNLQNACGGQLAQFKEEYMTASAYHNDAQWGLDYDCWMDNPNDINMRFGGIGNQIAAQWDADPYLNRWITIELRVYQWDRVEVYVNGTLKASVKGNSRLAAGRQFFPPGSAQLSNLGTLNYDPFNGGGNVTQPVGFIYGAGNYSSKQSLVYLGRSMLLPLS